MKIAIRSFALFLITAVAAHAHTSGLSHAHPHPENIGLFAVVLSGVSAGAVLWIAFRMINKGSREKQSR